MTKGLAMNKFLDPEVLLLQAGLTTGQTVGDLGAGSGFYALAAGKLIGPKGKVFVVDIVENVLSHIAAESRSKRLKNLQTLRCDLEQQHACGRLPDGSLDFIILANILHELSSRPNLFAETYRLLKTGGKVLVVEWNEQPGPLGPVMEKRVKPESVVAEAAAKTLKFLRTIETDRYHYGLIFSK